jgi:CRISPR-associated endonuclease/helicase Cas3
MIVILNNESEGKAWIRTRRILSKYLPQIGSRSWAGHISEEGLQDLHLALKKAVSKSGSVSCHRVTSRNHLELQWIAGNKKQFDEVGRYSFRTETSKPEFDTPLASGRKVMHLVVQLAALLHDIGKATQAFQSKLRGEYYAEYYRHDLMSFFMLKDRTVKYGDDQSWLSDFVDNPSNVFNWNQQNLLVNDPEPSLSGARLHELTRNTPILFTLLWLVLTHHRLPGGSIDLQFDSHINKIVEGSPIRVAPKHECMVLSEGQMPWQNQGWLQAVSSTSKQLLALIQGADGIYQQICGSLNQWVLVAAHWARPCLIYGDHLASIDKQLGGDITGAQRLSPLANTRVDDTASNRPRLAGDSLHDHLTKTRRYARRALLVSASPQILFRRASIPSSASYLSASSDSRYVWQQKLSTAIEHSTNGMRPAFVAVIAGTGCGKTIAGVRVMHALSGGNMRYTLALGLRSLTLQSAKAMISQAGFSPKDVAVAIGQPQSTNWVESQSAQARSNPSFLDGSESADSGEDYFELQLLDGGAIHNTTQDLPAWVRAFSLGSQSADQTVSAGLFEGVKHRAMIDIPILACTADHLVAAVEMRTGGSARMALRMMTSDLLLDEIDAYSAQDLQSIGKLAMLTGMAGKSVVVMSATANDVVVNGIYNAWAEGLKSKQLLDGSTTDLGVVILADQVSEPKCLLEHNVKLVRQAHQSLVTAMFAEHAVIKQRLEVLNLTHLLSCTDVSIKIADEKVIRESVFECIYLQALMLSEQNCSIDPQTGIKLALGFVRFNHAKNAWHFAKFLTERTQQSDEPEIRTLSYHSKHPRIVLGEMDSVLNHVLSRHNPSAIWDQHCIRAAIHSAQLNHRKAVVVIIATTTLQETGRDHDYDWAILEPRSVRGEIQASGRVRRHRSEPWSAVNVVILSHPLRTLLQTKAAPHWGLPGVEEPERSNQGKNPFGIGLSGSRTNELTRAGAFSELGVPFPNGAVSAAAPSMSRGRPPPKVSANQTATTAESVLPLEYWRSTGVTAAAALDFRTLESQSQIGILEALAQHLHLQSIGAVSQITNKDFSSLAQYLSPEVGCLKPPLTKHHALTACFRQGQRSIELLTLPDNEGGWEIRWFDDNANSQQYPNAKVLTSLVPQDKFLIAAKSTLNKLSEFSSGTGLKLGSLAWQLGMVQLDQYGDALPQVMFDPNLGFLVGTV